MPSFDIPIRVEFEFGIQCNECGRDLDYAEKMDSYGNSVYKIVPCPDCQERVEDASYNEGASDGRAEGYKDGHEDGYDKGYTDRRMEESE